MNTQDKRGQITLFIIVGIVLMFSFVVVLLVFHQNAPAGETAKSQTESFNSYVSSTRNYVDSCLEQGTDYALQLYSAKPGYELLLQTNIENSLISCVGGYAKAAKGFTVSYDKPIV